MGTESVLGIDISEKMLEYSRKHYSPGNITYQQMALEDLCALNQQFDVVTNSLVFDYVEDFDKLMKTWKKLRDDCKDCS